MTDFDPFAAGVPGAAGAPTILIAEDSMVVREVLRWHLEAEGYVVIEAGDGAEAVRLAEHYQPAVILLDVEMPTMNGHEALTALKSSPVASDIPVVFLTGRTETGDMVQGLRLGAHDYLGKPFEPAELIARVSAAARVKQLQDELKQRNAELDRMSRSDALTGLANRRHLTEQMTMAVSAAARHDHCLSVAIVDVDHFKHINDTYGHLSGDTVLVEMARRLLGAARTEDTVGRWGGEEFLMVLPWSDAANVYAVGERVRQAIADEPFVLDDGTHVHVTVSVGCASGMDFELVSRADAALYAAKEGGRNKTVSSTGDAQAQPRSPAAERIAATG